MKNDPAQLRNKCDITIWRDPFSVHWPKTHTINDVHSFCRFFVTLENSWFILLESSIQYVITRESQWLFLMSAGKTCSGFWMSFLFFLVTGYTRNLKRENQWFLLFFSRIAHPPSPRQCWTYPPRFGICERKWKISIGKKNETHQIYAALMSRAENESERE